MDKLDSRLEERYTSLLKMKRKYYVLLHKENFTCACVLKPHYAKFIKVSMENFILLRDKTCFLYRKVIFSLPVPSLTGTDNLELPLFESKVRLSGKEVTSA